MRIFLPWLFLFFSPAILAQPLHTSPRGKLFIIGGGDKSPEMMKELVRIAGLGPHDYVAVLPMASEFPDSSVIWTREDFEDTGVTSIVGMNFSEGEVPVASRLDSLRRAKLIFLGGGDQLRFMQRVQHTPVIEAIREAYAGGAVIAGTSAGASVMSEKMITGNQKKQPEYTGTFPTIESGNIELSAGLGLLKNAIIDQHFIRRQRLNRLLSLCIENPDEYCIGIDESTAILVEGTQARVMGEHQVIVIRNPQRSQRMKNGLLGARHLDLSIYLPGESFSLE